MWQEAHAICPLEERRGSKKSVLPNFAFFALYRFLLGCVTFGKTPMSLKVVLFTVLSKLGFGHVETSPLEYTVFKNEMFLYLASFFCVQENKRREIEKIKRS